MNDNYMPVGEVAPFDTYNCPTPGYSNELMATGRLKVSLVLTLDPWSRNGSFSNFDPYEEQTQPDLSTMPMNFEHLAPYEGIPFFMTSQPFFCSTWSKLYMHYKSHFFDVIKI